MKGKSLFLVIVFSIFCLASFGQVEKSLKRKVAIGRFSNETQYAKSVFYDKDNDPMGKQASDILSAKLASSGKFLLIERQDYDKIVAELEKNGGMSQQIGADYIIIGSITEFGRKTIGTQKVFSNSKKQIVEAGVNLRLVDVSTGMVIYSEEAKGEAETENKKVMGLGKSADYDATLSDKAISAAITKLVENVINKCMDKPWKAYILSVEDGVYFVSGGVRKDFSSLKGQVEKLEFETGDEFAVMQKGKQVKNPQTGLMIELPGKVVGKIRIEQTLGDTPQDEVAMASLVEGTIDANALDKYYVTELKKD